MTEDLPDDLLDDPELSELARKVVESQSKIRNFPDEEKIAMAVAFVMDESLGGR